MQALIAELAPRGSLHGVLEGLADDGQQATDAVLVRIGMQVAYSFDYYYD